MSDSHVPIELVECLRRNDSDARVLLRQLCLGPIERLVDRVITHYRPAVERKVVIDRTLRWVEMYLRSRPHPLPDGMDIQEFLALIVASAYKMLTPPKLDGPRQPVWAASDPLQCPNGYQVWRFCLPCEHVGGDWLDVDHASGENLWALVIDVTAHGYASYITAHALSLLWQARPIVELRAAGRSPREVLSVMSQELEPMLPDETFVEATLGRFTAVGEASVAGAGFCRVIYRRAGQACVSVRRIGGHLLGCFWGNDHEQEDWSLRTDDEVTIASDGLYEQPDEDGHHLEERIVESIERRLASCRITHTAVLEVLTDAVGDRSRRDDISVLSVLRCSEVRT
jgi:Stage II sporulation protein E (SpoIIE)